MDRGPEYTFFHERHTNSQQMQTKTKMRQHLTHARMIIIKKTSDNKKKSQIELSYDNPSFEYISEGNEITLKRCLHCHVPLSIIYNSQDIETT